MRASRIALSLLLLAPVAAAAQGPHPYLDLGFEVHWCASGWGVGGTSGFETLPDASTVHSGRQSLRIRYDWRGPWAADFSRVGTGEREFPVADVAGRDVRLTGWIRTEDVDDDGKNSGASLWWRVDDSEGRVVRFSSTKQVIGTTPWTQYAARFLVPADAAKITFGARFAASGTAWFDDIAIEVDGVPWRQGAAPMAEVPSPAAVAWVKKNAIRFTTAESGSGTRDLQGLKRLIGDARIVALGEDTHGTHEFFELKHRIVELLAGEMGFTRFAIEANMPEAYRVNRYVLTGEGDPRELLKGMHFWTWNTQEVLDMIEWMRAFNQSGRGRIEFLGFDMQYARVAAEGVTSFLAKAEPSYLGTARANLAQADRVVQFSLSTGGGVSPDASPAEFAARAVLDHMTEERDAYLARFPEEDVDWAIQNARVALQAVEMLTGTRERDASMADNVGWILDHAEPGAKIVLWAHNLHVARNESSMGGALARRYGDDMMVLGFAFGTGSYNAARLGLGVQANEILPPMPGSLESLLAAPRLPRYMLDLRRPTAPAAAWVRQPRPVRDIGAVRDDCAYDPFAVADLYDALIWFSDTTPSQLLPF